MLECNKINQIEGLKKKSKLTDINLSNFQVNQTKTSSVPFKASINFLNSKFLPSPTITLKQFKDLPLSPISKNSISVLLA